MEIDTTDLTQNIQMLQEKIAKLTNQLNSQLIPVLKNIEKTQLANLNSKLLETNNSTKNFGTSILNTVSGIGNFAGGIGDLNNFLGLFMETGAKGITTMAKLSLGIPAIAVAVSGLVSTWAAFVAKDGDYLRKLQEENQAVKDQIAIYKEAEEARVESVRKGTLELEHYEALYEELQGYYSDGIISLDEEERASAILAILSEVTGVQLQLTEGQIEGYGELSESFEQLMAQKKAMLILESQEEAYVEALKNRKSALDDVVAAEVDAQAKRDEIAYATKLMNEATDDTTREGFVNYIGRLEKELSVLEDTTNSKQQIYDEFSNDIGKYESNMAAAHSGNYDAMVLTDEEYLIASENNHAKKLELLKEEKTSTENTLETLKRMKDENGEYINKKEIEEYEEKLKLLNLELEATKTHRNVMLEEDLAFANDSIGIEEQKNSALGSSQSKYINAYLGNAIGADAIVLAAKEAGNEAILASEQANNETSLANQMQAYAEKKVALQNAFANNELSQTEYQLTMATLEAEHNATIQALEDQSIQESTEKQAANYLTQEEMANTSKANLLAAEIEGNTALLLENHSRSREFLASGKDNMDSYASGMKSEKENVRIAGEDAVTTVIEELDRLPTESATIGSNVVASLTKELENREHIGKLGRAASYLGTVITTGTRGALEIASPSKVMQKIGGFVVEGLQIGMEEEEESTLQQAQLFGENIINTMQDELNQSLDIPEVNKNILTDVVTDFSTSKYHNQTQSDLATLTGLLTKYLPYIAEHSSKDILLNDRTLVGKLAPKMDIALANISLKKGRGI